MKVDEEALELAAQAVYECNAGTMTWAEIKGRTREADCRHEAEEAITAYLAAMAENGCRLVRVEDFQEAVNDWEYNTSYKGDYLTKKHTDLERLAAVKARHPEIWPPVDAQAKDTNHG